MKNLFRCFRGGGEPSHTTHPDDMSRMLLASAAEANRLRMLAAEDRERRRAINDGLRTLVTEGSGGSIVTQAGPSERQPTAPQPFDKSEILHATRQLPTGVCCIPIKDRMVAVKVYGLETNFSTFTNELQLLEKMIHPNVIDFLGHCSGIDREVIIYDSVPLGFLNEYLFGRKRPLDWNRRMKIAVETARGLEYVHNKMNLNLVSVKPENILLDKGFVPKITEFGPAQGRARLSSYELIYKFGVLLIQLLTGKPDMGGLVSWVEPHFNNGDTLRLLVDPKLGRRYPEEGLVRAFEAVKNCISSPPETRPDMNSVVMLMTQATDFLMPPDPVHAEGRTFTW